MIEPSRGQWDDGICQPNAKSIKSAGDRLRSGQLVAFPTETVYGLGADATNDHAVRSVFAAKGRPQSNPLIVHVPDAEGAAKLTRFDDRAVSLAAAFWPGPLTLVLERAADCPVATRVSAGLSTIAVRAPNHAVAQAVLKATGRPLAAPSANPSGRLSPTTAEHAAEGLDGGSVMILDGGPCTVGIESTVLAVDEDTPIVLRPGAVSAGALADVLGHPVELSASAVAIGPARSPGTMASHYAPRAKLRLNANAVAGDEGLLAFGAGAPPGAAITRNLSDAADLGEAAERLYRYLREIDQSGVRVIAVAPIPSTGIGAAINDRLDRAAAPRG